MRDDESTVSESYVLPQSKLAEIATKTAFILPHLEREDSWGTPQCLFSLKETIRDPFASAEIPA